MCSCRSKWQQGKRRKCALLYMLGMCSGRKYVDVRRWLNGIVERWRVRYRYVGWKDADAEKAQGESILKKRAWTVLW